MHTFHGAAALTAHCAAQLSFDTVTPAGQYESIARVLFRVCEFNESSACTVSLRVFKVDSSDARI